MSRQPQTNFDLSDENVGSSESDTALRLWPALQVAPLRFPSMCIQKTILPSARARSLASPSDVFQEMAVVSRETSFLTSGPFSAVPLVGTEPFLSFRSPASAGARMARLAAMASRVLMAFLLNVPSHRAE